MHPFVLLVICVELVTVDLDGVLLEVVRVVVARRMDRAAVGRQCHDVVAAPVVHIADRVGVRAQRQGGVRSHERHWQFEMGRRDDGGPGRGVHAGGHDTGEVASANVIEMRGLVPRSRAALVGRAPCPGERLDHGIVGEIQFAPVFVRVEALLDSMSQPLPQRGELLAGWVERLRGIKLQMGR